MQRAKLIVIGCLAATSSINAPAAHAQINGAGDVTGLVLQYQAFFTQNSTSPPAASTTHTCSAFISFDPSVEGIDFVDVIKPGGGSVSTSGSGTFYTTSQSTYATRTALMTNWPSGNYTFSVTDFDEVTTNFTLPQPSAAGAWPTSIPTFTPASYTGLQSMNPTQSRLVEVNPFTPTPPTNGQLSGLYISQRFGSLPGPTVWSSLTTIGSPTSSRTIPANALQPNTDYFATWIFDHRFSTSFPPPAVVEFTNVTFGHVTRVAFRTGAATIACAADLDNGSGNGTPDGGVDINDLLYFLTEFEAGSTNADLDNGSNNGTPDGGVDINDLLFFLTHFEAGC
jgi:hypothetical protein